VDLRVMWHDSADWNHMGQDMDQWRALENTVLSLRVA
jgi:hypothetical protein